MAFSIGEGAIPLRSLFLGTVEFRGQALPGVSSLHCTPPSQKDSLLQSRSVVTGSHFLAQGGMESRLFRDWPLEGGVPHVITGLPSLQRGSGRQGTSTCSLGLVHTYDSGNTCTHMWFWKERF